MCKRICLTAVVIVLLTVPACGRSTATGIAAQPTATEIAAQPAASEASTQPTQGGNLQVQITSPSPGSNFAAGQPLTVEFAASGGPFAVIDLVVDSTVVDEIMNVGEVQYIGSLTWATPSGGAHQLLIAATDANKNLATAEVDVQITGEAAVATTTPAADAGGIEINFLNVTDGGSLPAAIGSVNGLDNQPIVTLSLEVTGPAVAGVGLTVDGVYVGGADNKASASPFRADIVMPALHGGVTYQVTASTGSLDKQFQTSKTITFTVTGLAEFTPTPPPLNRAAATRQMIDLFREKFGLTVTAPALARFESPYPPARQWVSVAYIGDKMYEIDLYDDTHVQVYWRPIGHAESGNSPICRPTGDYRILVVLEDYGNLGTTQGDAEAALRQAGEAANAFYAQYAAEHGLQTPLLQLQLTSAYLAPPHKPGQLLNSADIQAATGMDPSQFDLLAQVDLDADQTTSRALAAGGEGAQGLAAEGCGVTPRDVNLWIQITNSIDLADGLRGTLLDHELSHVMGYNGLHNWPCGDGSSQLAESLCPALPRMPTLLFGWEDTDGDGVPEILDATPYGSSGP